MKLHDLEHPNKISLDRYPPTLVIGGAGFIGSHTVEALLAHGGQVRVLDNLSTGKLQNLPSNHPGLEFVLGDLLDAHKVREAMSGMKWCVHLAAQISAVRSIEEPVESATCNVLGFINVLEAARATGLDRLVYASSAAVYGDADTLPLAEDAPRRPINPYGLEKLVDEEYAALYERLHGLRALGLRYFNVYGPRQDPKSPYSGVISKFLDRLGAGESPTVFGDGHQTRDFIHVKDVARANLVALASDRTGVCNVATGGRVELLQLLDILRDCMHTEVEAEFEPARPGDIRHSSGSPSRLRELLHFAAEHGLEDGLAELAEYWADEQRAASAAVAQHQPVRGNGRRAAH